MSQFKPKALSEIQMIAMTIDYVTDKCVTIRSLAEDYGIGKSTAHAYMRYYMSSFDKRLAKLVELKAAAQITNKQYKCKAAVKKYLTTIRKKLDKLNTEPSNWEDYLWHDYISAT